MKFDRHIGSTAAKVPVKFHSDRTILNTNLVASRLYEILRKEVFSDIETGPWGPVSIRKPSVQPRYGDSVAHYNIKHVAMDLTFEAACFHTMCMFICFHYQSIWGIFCYSIKAYVTLTAVLEPLSWCLFFWSSHCKSVEDQAPLDESYRFPIFKWVAETWPHDRVPGQYTPNSGP